MGTGTENGSAQIAPSGARPNSNGNPSSSYPLPSNPNQYLPGQMDSPTSGQSPIGIQNPGVQYTIPNLVPAQQNTASSASSTSWQSYEIDYKEKAAEMGCVDETYQVIERLSFCVDNSNGNFMSVDPSQCKDARPPKYRKVSNPQLCGNYIGPFGMRETQPGNFSFGINQGTRCGGSGIESDPYLICTPNDFISFMYDAAGFGGMLRFRGLHSNYYKLAADIDISKAVLPSIHGTSKGLMSLYFSLPNGTFDGNGHKIIFGTNQEGPRAWAGFFLSDSTLKNLTLVNPVTSVNGTLGMSTQATDMIENCHVQNGKVRIRHFDYGGGLLTYLVGTLKNSSFQGRIEIVDPINESGGSNPTSVGGLVGLVIRDPNNEMGLGGQILGSKAQFEIEETSTRVETIAAGGIAGFTGTAARASGNTASGSIRLKSSKSYAGGILGLSFHGYLNSTTALTAYNQSIYELESKGGSTGVTPKYAATLWDNSSANVTFFGIGRYSSVLGGCGTSYSWGDQASYLCSVRY